MEHKLWFMGTSYVPGEARTLIDNLEDSAHREMARAEFYYFRGESEKGQKFPRSICRMKILYSECRHV